LAPFLYDKEFYECWRVIRKDFEGNKQITEALDSAFEEYIVNGRKPAENVGKKVASHFHDYTNHEREAGLH